MCFKQVLFRQMTATALAAIAIGFLAGGCSTQSNPGPQSSFPAQAYIPPRPPLTADQMSKLCQEAPDTCHRVQTAQPLTVDDVTAMVKVGFDSNTIIEQIRNSRTVYHLSAKQIISLKDAGANNELLDFMLTTPGAIAGASPISESMAKSNGAQAPPPAPVPENAPPPPGPDYAWVDGDWIWNGGWVWVGGHWAYPPYPRAIWVHGGWGRDMAGYHYTHGHWR
jgi:hypothetical protein